MSLVISDVEVYVDAAGVTHPMTGPALVVVATPSAVPITQATSGVYQEDQLGARRAAVTASTGAWTLTLPWPSETRYAAGTELWQVRRMGGSLYQGYVPEGIAGPLTLDNLVQNYGSATAYKWQIVQAGTQPSAPYTAVPGPKGDQGVQGIQGPSGTLTPATTSAIGGLQLPHLPELGNTPVAALQEDTSALAQIAALLDGPNITETLLANTTIPTSTGTLYTAPSPVNMLLTQIRVTNYTGSAGNVTLSVVGADTVTITILAGNKVTAGKVSDISLCFALSPGDQIKASCTVSGVTLELWGLPLADGFTCGRLTEALALTSSPVVLGTIALDRWYMGEVLFQNTGSTYAAPAISVVHADGSPLTGLSATAAIPPGAITPASFRPRHWLGTGDKLALSCPQSGVLMTVSIVVAGDFPPVTSVPSEHSTLYSTLGSALTSMDTVLSALSPTGGAPHPVTWATNVLVANSNNGPLLWGGDPYNSGTAATAIAAAKTNIDALALFGCTGLTLSLNYPMLYGSTYNGGSQTNVDYAHYVDFYTQICAYIKGKGLVLEIELGVAFSGTTFATIPVNYTGLTLTEFTAEFKTMAQAIITAYSPNYISIGTEFDTMVGLLIAGGANTGGQSDPVDPLNTDAGAVAWATSILSGLSKVGGDSTVAKIECGQGTWLPSTRVQGLCGVAGIDCISLHVYPTVPAVSGDGTTAHCIANCIGFAQGAGKRLTISEAWAYKSYIDEGASPATSQAIFRRDIFDFYEPLDIQFMDILRRCGEAQHIELVSLFWGSRYWFAGAMFLYNQANAQGSYTTLSATSSAAAIAAAAAYTPGGNPVHLSRLGVAARAELAE